MHLHVDYKNTTFDDLTPDGDGWTVAFKKQVVHAPTLKGDTLLCYCAMKKPKKQKHFVKAICDLFKYKWLQSLLGFSAVNMFHAPSVFIFKFDPSLVLAGSLADIFQPQDDIPAFRVVYFSEDVHIHVAQFQNTDSQTFKEKQNLFFKSVKSLECGVKLLGSDIFGNQTGGTVSMTIKKNRVLVMPSPCFFYPVTGGKLVYMATMLFQRFSGSPLQDKNHGLQLMHRAALFDSKAGIKVRTASVNMKITGDHKNRCVEVSNKDCKAIQKSIGRSRN